MELKKKNKKGQVLITLTTVGIIAVILFILIFTAGILSFLKNNWAKLLGVFLFIGAVIFIIKSQADTKFKTTIFLVLLAIGAIFVFSSGVLQTEYGEITPPSSLDNGDFGLCSGGLTALSVDQVDIIDPDGTKQKIRVTIIPKGSECLKAELKASALDSELNSQQETQKST